MQGKELITKAILVLPLIPLLTGCAPALVAAGVAAGAGATAGYYVGKSYDVKVQPPVDVEKRQEE